MPYIVTRGSSKVYLNLSLGLIKSLNYNSHSICVILKAYFLFMIYFIVILIKITQSNNIFQFSLLILNQHLSIYEIMLEVEFLGKQSLLQRLVKKKFIREYTWHQLLWKGRGAEVGRQEAGLQCTLKDSVYSTQSSKSEITLQLSELGQGGWGNFTFICKQSNAYFPGSNISLVKVAVFTWGSF